VHVLGRVLIDLAVVFADGTGPVIVRGADVAGPNVTTVSGCHGGRSHLAQSYLETSEPEIVCAGRSYQQRLMPRVRVSCTCSSMSWAHSLARSPPRGERKACSLPGPGKQTCNNLVVDSQPLERRPEEALPVVRLGRLQSHAWGCGLAVARETGAGAGVAHTGKNIAERSSVQAGLASLWLTLATKSSQRPHLDPKPSVSPVSPEAHHLTRTSHLEDCLHEY
jgi:hypothetical protein